MKKEVLAVGILILLTALSIWNLKHIGALTSDLSELLTASHSNAVDGNWEQASSLAQKAFDHWTNSANYTNIFLRHSEIDLTSDAFADYLIEIYRRDTGGAKGALEKLLGHLSNIYDMEQISFRSVF